jgi:hypothetical protein
VVCSVDSLVVVVWSASCSLVVCALQALTETAHAAARIGTSTFVESFGIAPPLE